MRYRKGFRNVNINNGLFFFERCSLITATARANKFVCTRRRSYETISFEEK